MRTFGRPAPPPVVPPQKTDGILEARAAQQASKDRLLDAVDSGVKSRELAARMAELKKRNHFGPSIIDAIRKAHP